MMEFESIVDVQMSAMLEGIEKDLAQRREAILQAAAEQARTRLREARRQARQRMASTIAEEKDLWYSSLGRASASLASRLRRKQQEFDREQLQTGEEKLRSALQARWDDAGARREWSETLLEDARALLPPGHWIIEYPASLDEAEAAELLALSSPELTVELAPTNDLDAGFRLVAGEARLDMSIDGLLALKEEIAGELLAEIRRQQLAEGPQ
jgi:hypothetical protein